MTNKPTIAELEAALNAYDGHEENHNDEATILSAARIGLRALKAKQAGAKMLGAVPTEHMVSFGFMVMDCDGMSDVDLGVKRTFEAMHAAAPCLLEGE